MNERRLIAKHALTVWVGQIAVMAFGVTDTVVAGRYAESALAALSVGSAIYISVFVTLMGVLQATLPMFSELNGAGRPRDMGRLLRQAIYIWLAQLRSRDGLAHECQHGTRMDAGSDRIAPCHRALP